MTQAAAMKSEHIPYARVKAQVLAEMTDSFPETSMSGLFAEVEKQNPKVKGLTVKALQSAFTTGTERCSRKQSAAILKVANLPEDFAPWYGGLSDEAKAQDLTPAAWFRREVEAYREGLDLEGDPEQVSLLGWVDLEEAQGSENERPLILQAGFHEDVESAPTAPSEGADGERFVPVALCGAVLMLELSKELKPKRGSVLGAPGSWIQVGDGVKMKAIRGRPPLAWEIKSTPEQTPIMENFVTSDPGLCVVTGAREGGEVTAQLRVCAKICPIVPSCDGVNPEDLSIAQVRILEVLEKKPFFPRGRNEYVLDAVTLPIKPAAVKPEADQ